MEEKLRTFIQNNFLLGDKSRAIKEDESFLQNGIIDSTGVLELLSLPGGYYSSKVKRMAQELGYEGICTSKFGLNENNTDPFELKRISLRFDDPFSQFVSIVNQDKKLYLKKKLRDNSLSFLKAILGPNNYFKLWNFYQSISTKKTQADV